jgi:hypothetical protein
LENIFIRENLSWNWLQIGVNRGDWQRRRARQTQLCGRAKEVSLRAEAKVSFTDQVIEKVLRFNECGKKIPARETAEEQPERWERPSGAFV